MPKFRDRVRLLLGGRAASTPPGRSRHAPCGRRQKRHHFFQRGSSSSSSSSSSPPPPPPSSSSEPWLFHFTHVTDPGASRPLICRFGQSAVGGMKPRAACRSELAIFGPLLILSRVLGIVRGPSLELRAVRESLEANLCGLGPGSLAMMRS